MGRDRSGYNFNYEPARDSGVQPVGAFRKEYDGPISYGGANDPPAGGAPPPGAPQPAGYYPAPAYPYPTPVPGATPYVHPVVMPGAAPISAGVVAPAGPWYTSRPVTPASAAASFAPFGAKPAGVKTTSGDDRPLAVMVTPAIASDKATVQTHLQLRWDLRFPPTPGNFDANGGAIPDLSQPATNPPTRAMYIVAEELPWAISIKRYNVITCQDVLDAIYKALREPIKRDEFFAANPKKRHQITKISLTEARDPSSERQPVWNESKDISRPADPLRIDWLGALTDFRGLFIDDKVLHERCTWQIDDLQDAWVLDLGLNPNSD